MPHDLLLLERFGIKGKNLAWFQNYFKERTQRLVIRNDKSVSIPIESGVPQGGVLSGTLFALYINDIVDCFQNCDILLYADDAKIFAPVNGKTSVESVQSDLDRFFTWCKIWRTPPNIGKCFFLHYGRKIQNAEIEVDYNLNSVSLKKERQAKDLGIIVSDDLKWHQQFTAATKKAKSKIHIIRRTFKSRNPKFLAYMYNLRVRPHLE